jgi:antirestriction protein
MTLTVNIMTMTNPRIYVASLADYNAGNLLGKWIDANQSAEEIREEITAMLATSKEGVAEEWAIHDYEGFGPVKLPEWEDLGTVAELAEMIGEKGELFALVYEHADRDMERAKILLEDGYFGEFDSLEAYAEDYIEQTGGLEKMPEHLRYYFDYEKFAHDLEIGGDVFTIEHQGKVHVFDAHI